VTPGQAALVDEWRAWMDTRHYAASQREGFEGYGGGEMFDAYQAGRLAAIAAQQPPAVSGEREQLEAVATTLTKAIERLGMDRARAMADLQKIIDQAGDPLAVDDIANACLDALQANTGGTLPPAQPAPELAAAMRETAEVRDGYAKLCEEFSDSPQSGQSARISLAVLNRHRVRAGLEALKPGRTGLT
jgi:hypothetical protein